MSLFTDLFRLVSVAFGLGNSAKQFQENLEMAERYIRWGKERGDPRDFISAMQCLDKCINEDAPRGEAMIRKYCAYADAYLGAMALEVRAITNKVGQMKTDQDSRHGELSGLEATLKKQQTHIQELRAQGSMIQAAEEEGRAKETQAQIKRLGERLQEEGNPQKVAVIYAGCIKEFMTYRMTLESRLAELNGTSIPKDEIGRIHSGARDRLALLDKEAVAATPEGVKPPAALAGA